MSSQKYGAQIELRKAKLEKIRKEREILHREKERRSIRVQEEKDKRSIEKETREKAKQLNDSGSLNNKQVNLKISNLKITEIPPIETLKYSKQTQTDITGGRLYDDFKCDNDDEAEEAEDEVGALRIFCNFSSMLPPGILSPGLPNVKPVQPAFTPLDECNPFMFEEITNKPSTEEHAQELLLSEDFQASLIRAGRIMEKVISENKNIFIDYTGNKDICDQNSKGLVVLNRTFYDDTYSKNRCITCMDWSTQFPELLLTSYHKNEEALLQPDGIVMVWNTKFKSHTPEFVFNCHSAVMSTCFTKFNPNLILGGTYSGQIVLWDNRVRKPIPIQCTRLNSKAHTQPIHCLQMVGTENSHNIISISSDGKLCSWSLDMLSQPLDTMQFQLDVSEKQKKPIAVTCMAFPENGINSLILGGEDGCAYSAFRYGYKSGINDRFKKHEGPITGISSHYNQLTPDFGHLFLTSSTDCTIKLWSLQDSKSVYTFKDNFDYIMDVAWSPIHPAIFAAVDVTGRLDLWNLNQDTEEPIIRVIVPDEPALNRISWTPNGQHITVGDDNGKLYVYNVAEHLANPSPNEWLKLNDTLNSIQVNYSIECCD